MFRISNFESIGLIIICYKHKIECAKVLKAENNLLLL